MSKPFSLRYTLSFFFLDLIVAVASLFLASQLREIVPLGKQLGSGDASWALPWFIYLLTAVIWATTFVILNIYSPRQAMQSHIVLAKVVGATIFAWMILAGMLYLTFREISRLQFLYFLVLDISLGVLFRRAMYATLRSRAGQHSFARRVLIVGTGPLADSLAELVQNHRWMGLELIGFVSQEDCVPDLSYPVLGKIDDTLRIVERENVHEVMIALPRDDFHQMRKLITHLQALPVNIRLVPDYFDMVFLRLDFENFSGMPLLSLKAPVLDPFQRLVKRTFDLIVTLVALVPGLPLMGAIALMIRLDSPGPVLFKQQRVGEGGRLFTMLKFRTMVVGAEAQQDQINNLDEDGHLIHKRIDDPRVTRVGSILRRTSLDELPQLFNILRGEMSLVGPRPEMPWLVNLYEPWQRKRFEVPQGLTGWWQINGRSDKPMHLYTEEDLYYIRNYSIWMDMSILWRTVQTVLQGRGAY